MVGVNFIFTVLAATAVVASPAASPEDYSLEARAGQIYTCKKGPKNDGALIGTVSQDKAIGYFRQAKTQTGTRSGYPKPFANNGNEMKFASGCSKDVWELPVLKSGKPHDINKKKTDDVNDPGPMRVYYTKDLKFCGIGAKSNADNSGAVHSCKV